MAGGLLTSQLRPLHDVLARRDLVECSVNADGSVWIKVQGNPLMFQPEGLEPIAPDRLVEICEGSAGEAAEVFDDTHILATGTFEFHIETMAWPRKMRFQAVRAPGVYGGPAAISFRAFATGKEHEDFKFDRLRSVTRSLEDEIAANASTILAMAQDPNTDFDEVLRALARERMNVIISGATDSGKSTLTRRYVSFVPPEERIITVEKGVELFPPHPNKLMLQSDDDENSTRAPARLLEACLRLNPQRIIMGELRGSEAVTFLEAINSGHEGSLTTLHASSARQAFSKLSSLIRKSGARIDNSELLEMFRTSIHCVIQVMEDRTTGRRGIAEVWMPGLDNHALARSERGEHKPDLQEVS